MSWSWPWMRIKLSYFLTHVSWLTCRWMMRETCVRCQLGLKLGGLGGFKILSWHVLFNLQMGYTLDHSLIKSGQGVSSLEGVVLLAILGLWGGGNAEIGILVKFASCWAQEWDLNTPFLAQVKTTSRTGSGKGLWSITSASFVVHLHRCEAAVAVLIVCGSRAFVLLSPITDVNLMPFLHNMHVTLH